MKIYYMVPLKNFESHRDIYTFTRQLLLDGGASLLGDWISDYSPQDSAFARKDSSQFYQDAVKNITECDLAIFDVTVSSTSIGHQMTYALNLQKPTLVLSDGMHKQAGDLFIAGAHVSELKVNTYDSKADITAAVRRFLEDNVGLKKYRLNLVLDKPQQEYVLWAARYYHESKTEIVNRAIDKMRESDVDFRRLRTDQTK